MIDLRTLKAYAKMMDDNDLLVLIVDGDKVQMQKNPNPKPKLVAVKSEGGVDPKMLKKPNEAIEIMRATGKLPGSVRAAREGVLQKFGGKR